MEKQAKETQSTPLFTTRALFALIWPMLMEQFLSITMGMADTFMVSGVGEAAVSSVSLVDSINVLVTQLFAALTVAEPLSQASIWGAGTEKAQCAVRRSCTRFL